MFVRSLFCIIAHHPNDVREVRRTSDGVTGFLSASGNIYWQRKPGEAYRRYSWAHAAAGLEFASNSFVPEIHADEFLTLRHTGGVFVLHSPSQFADLVRRKVST
jgi:hypothetical protein